MKKEIHVLHAPTTVGGNSSRLSKAEKKIGLNSFVVSTEKNYLNYDADLVITGKNNISRTVKVLAWFCVRIWKYDVVHFNFGRTLLPAREIESKGGDLKEILFKIYYFVFGHLDLKILYLSRKPVFVTFQGDDARQGDYCRANYKIHFVHVVSKDYFSDARDTWKRRKIDSFDRYADVIYSVNPDLLHILPKRAKFLPYAGVDLNEWKPIYPREGTDFTPHIVHAPSHRAAKGTKYIEEAIVKLKKEGVNLKFTLVEGISNAEAKLIYEQADLLVDQLLTGFYGGLSVELMSLGKVVMCYLCQADIELIPTEMREDIPIINVNPDTIYEVLKEWLTVRKSEFYSKGKDSRYFVEKWHDPMKVASIVKKDYEDVLRKKMT